MDGFESGISVPQASRPEDLNQSGDCSTEDAVFDASQYAFFGSDVFEEIELGGLEDEEEDFPAAGIDEEGLLFDKEEVEVLRSQSDVGDLAGTFSKLNRDLDGSMNAELAALRESRQISFATEWAQGEDYSNWYALRKLDSESTPDGKRWPLQPFSSAHISEPKKLHRTASYPDQQQHHQLFSSEPIRVQKSSYISYPQGDGRLQNQHSGPRDIPYHSGGPQMGSSPNLSPFANSQAQLGGIRHGSPQFSGNLPQFPPGLSMNNQPPAYWMNHPDLYGGENSHVMKNLLPQQQFPQPNELVTPQLITQMQVPQNRLPHPVQPSFGHLPAGMQSQLFNSHLSPSPSLGKYDAILGMGDLSEGRSGSAQSNRQNLRFLQQGFDSGVQRRDIGWPHFRSKYMSANEIENILRTQLTATHSNDPYVDDYYHQACLAKKSAGAKLKHHFCPTHLRDLPPRGRANNEPHAFLQVDALGRVPFSSIRRPRPLLEVDPPNAAISSNSELKDSGKPLEQEPLLAARVTIEDGFCLLLDVDDIDRFIEFNQLQDGGNQLRQRRQALLEGLASSLQLVDPLGKNNGQNSRLSSTDDFVFLRIVSLPKGRKLLARYLKILYLGSELMRIVCMAIFRHLRSLFGVLPSDQRAIETTKKLAKIVASCVHRMDLGPISACLAAVSCSSEQPPLRPLGSPSGDGASFVLKSVFDRATEILRATNFNNANMVLWRASFDEFFNLLMKYCINKYDSIMQALCSEAPQHVASELSDSAAQAIIREMPIELLRASFPHINEQQKRVLMEFLKRSMLGSNDKQME